MRIITVFLLLSISAINAHAAPQQIEAHSLRTLPVLHQGRVQPLDTVARFYAVLFADTQTPHGQDPIDWLAQTIFVPDMAIINPIFKIEEPEILELQPSQHNLYSFVAVSVALQHKQDIVQQLLVNNPEDWTPHESQLMALYEKNILYTQLLRTMTLFLPYGDQKKSIWQAGLIQGEQSQFIIDSARQNVLLRLMPMDDTFVTPWALYFDQQDKRGKTQTTILDQWQNIVLAYRSGDQEKWEQSLESIHDDDQASYHIKHRIEVFYNLVPLLPITLGLFGMVILLSFAGIKMPSTAIKRLEIMAYVIAAACLCLFLACRSIILVRPPVATLYESVLFVSFIVAVIGGYFYRYRQSLLPMMMAMMAFAFLVTAQNFASESDMAPLVAVLNTSFWLSAHVLTITIGYGLCFICAALAHILLVRKNNKIASLLTIMILSSLLFTVVGTVLGGIWADQSWGRFWGWDPKENGALLIVLWLGWVIHGRLSHQLTGRNYYAAVSFLSVIVVLAWLGVNLLNVGLHSYGFVTGVATGILVFAVLEILIIGSLYYLGCKTIKNEN